MPPNNPFHYTRAVDPEEFVGSRFLIDALLAEIGRCTSALLVGSTRSGRTSILRRLVVGLRAPAAVRPAEPAGGRAGFLPLFLDAQTLAEDAAERDFWELALHDLDDRAELEAVAARGFTFDAIVDLFTRLARWGSFPVLLIDHIDAVFDRPRLCTQSFLGRLRSMSCGAALVALVATSTRTATQINRKLPEGWRGSPFNHMLEYVLGFVPRADIDELLDRGGTRFSIRDRDFIATLAAGDLYLAQVIAACLWVFNGRRTPCAENREGAGRAALQLVDATFDAHWRSWGIGERTLVLTLALAQLGAPREEIRAAEDEGPAHPRGGAALELSALLAAAYSVAELRRLMARLGDGELVRALPGGAASEQEVHDEAAAIVLRHGVAEPLIRELIRERPQHHVKIHALARLLGIGNVAVSFGDRLVTVPDYDGLVRRGVLVGEGPTLRIRSPMRLWWLVDRTRALARDNVLAPTWFAEVGLGDNSPPVKAALRAEIEAIRDRLCDGSIPFLREAAR